jgi:predicted  nucleic acid-binding Zn-ribbon protein
VPHKCANCAYDIPHNPKCMPTCPKCGWADWSTPVSLAAIKYSGALATTARAHSQPPARTHKLTASTLYREMYEILKGKGSKPNGK